MSARNRDIVCVCVCPPISFSLPPSSLLSLSLSLCIHPSVSPRGAGQIKAIKDLITGAALLLQATHRHTDTHTHTHTHTHTQRHTYTHTDTDTHTHTHIY